MVNDDYILIEEIQKWDFDLFIKLFNKYFKKIYSYLLLKSDGNTYVAEDVTATTFTKSFENINKFSTNKNNSPFIVRLYSIAYHTFSDIQKYRDTNDNKEDGPTQNNMEYTKYFQSHNQTKSILDYLDQFWTYKKDLYILKVFNNFSYDEISQIIWKRSSKCEKDFLKLNKQLEEHLKI